MIQSDKAPFEGADGRLDTYPTKPHFCPNLMTRPNKRGPSIMERIFQAPGGAMHCRYRVMSLGFFVLMQVVPAFSQGPGGYNPIGPGVDLAGNWGPVFHEDAHERGPGPELANYLGLPIT